MKDWVFRVLRVESSVEKERMEKGRGKAKETRKRRWKKEEKVVDHWKEE